MNHDSAPLRLGTRGSMLALWQSEHVRARLNSPCELCIIKTQGDKFLEAALQTQNGKGFFTVEIEEAMLRGEIDLAVHSLKDLPTEQPPGLRLGAILTRAAAGDMLLVHPEAHAPERALPVRAGGRVGASSLRRQSLLARYAPDLVPTLLRGNVPTRLARLRAGDYEAIILARAGLERLGLDLSGLHAYALNSECWLPAPGQGAVAVECRADDERLLSVLRPLHDETCARAVDLERRLLSRFEGGCHAAFGALVLAQDDARALVRVGHEDEGGIFRHVCVTAEWSAAEEVAYAALRRELAAPLADSTTEALCLSLSASC